MSVVIEHFLERAAINHGLVSLEAVPLFSLERFDCYRTKLNPFNCSPRIDIAFENLNSIKASILKRDQKTFLCERTRNAAAPKFRIVLHFLRNFFIADDVCDDRASPFFQDAENFGKELRFRFWFDQ